jgi:TonB family protein
LHILFFVPLPHIRLPARGRVPEETEFVYRPEQRIPAFSKLISERPMKEPVSSAGPGKAQGHPDTAGRLPKPEEKNQAAEKTIPARPPAKAAVSIKPSIIDTSMLIADDEKDLSSEPIYLDYYNAIRGQIYKSAQANRPYYFMEGGVTLVFTLSRTGRLLNSGIVQERSTRNPILQRHALASIEHTTPFPPFHESMKEQELTLRITISFEK